MQILRAADNRIIAPDVSFYQENPTSGEGINFEMMARAGAAAVIIRAGQRSWKDKAFDRSWAAARRAGLPRGSYFFYDSRDRPKMQAELWIQILGDDQGEGPLFCDFEEMYNGNYKGWKYWFDFIERIKELAPAKMIGIYTGFYYWIDNTKGIPPASLEYFHQFPLWIANYGTDSPSIPKPWAADEWALWQFTDKGPGAAYGAHSKGIDLNYFHSQGAFDVLFGEDNNGSSLIAVYDDQRIEYQEKI